MRTCACGAGNPDTAKFCAECGRSLTAPATPPPAPGPLAFDPRWLLGPITTIEGARTMAWIGAAGAGLLFLIVLVRGAPILSTGFSLLALMYLLRLAVYGGSAFALYRGWTIGGLASLLLHGFSLLQGMLAYGAYRRANPLQEIPLTAGGLLLTLLSWIIIPAALVCGIRGAMAWNRFRRGEATPPTSR